MKLLVGESFSPWTRKARWALDYCEVEYGYREYTPFVSEPLLRVKLNKWAAPLSVPILLTDAEAVHGSFDIAKYAARLAGRPGFALRRRIAFWNDVSETGIASARKRVLTAVLGSTQALDELSPLRLGFLTPVVRPLTRFAVRRLQRKYRNAGVANGHRASLLALQRGLQRSESGFLLREFSYADVAMAGLLDAVVPEWDTELSSAHCECWRDDSLAKEFADLVRWRDRLQPFKARPSAQAAPGKFPQP